VSKHWNPGRQTVELRPSRIRRDPLLIPEPPKKKAAPPSRESEILLGVVGVTIFAAAIAVLIMAFSAITGHGDGTPAVAQSTQFVRCGVGDSPNCVIDAETIRIGNEPVRIAGIEAPSVRSPQCAREADRGRDAVERLIRLLNSGTVTRAGNVREFDGTVHAKVLVDGRDVGTTMISGGMAREYAGGAQSWC
jgi:endonuclease YncB( thermonuclease family)